MIPIIYYAHSMAFYNTQREEEELYLIQLSFPNALIYNPNRPNIQNDENPMLACVEIVRDEAVTGIVFSKFNGTLSPGVKLELKVAQKNMKQVYCLENGMIQPIAELL
jgi:hypothetical protein